ncbi:hypothetical protein C8Q73DRAFT_524471 [Cubamyces lactineus]|nr:hypothetical protein C8Q73DRAFT_524471 [Cubamyces lactineus]
MRMPIECPDEWDRATRSARPANRVAEYGRTQASLATARLPRRFSAREDMSENAWRKKRAIEHTHNRAACQNLHTLRTCWPVRTATGGGVHLRIHILPNHSRSRYSSWASVGVGLWPRLARATEPSIAGHGGGQRAPAPANAILSRERSPHRVSLCSLWVAARARARPAGWRGSAGERVSCERIWTFLRLLLADRVLTSAASAASLPSSPAAASGWQRAAAAPSTLPHSHATIDSSLQCVYFRWRVLPCAPSLPLPVYSVFPSSVRRR